MVTEVRPRGRAALKVRTGLFIKEYLEEVGEDSITGIRQAYVSRMWVEVNQYRAKAERVHVGTYESFVKYFGHLRRLGLVEFVRDEPTEWVPHERFLSIRLLEPWPDSELPRAEVVRSTRRIYRLSDLGRSEVMAAAWEDPLMRGLFREALVGRV